MTEKSKTARAAELHLKKGLTVLQASLQVGVSSPSVHAYLKRERLKAEGRCPCCGQRLPEARKAQAAAKKAAAKGSTD